MFKNKFTSQYYLIIIKNKLIIKYKSFDFFGRIYDKYDDT